MLSFNLIDEKWLPVIMTDDRFEEVTLYDALANAHNIREIICDSPIEAISLYRFLQAFVIRIFDCMSSKSNWLKLHNQTRFDANLIKEYLDKWHNRFDLFDKEHPFYQHPDPFIKNRQPIEYLQLHRLTNDFFEHNVNQGIKEVKAAELAIGLITTQCFSLGGLLAPGKPNSRATFYLKKWMFWVDGADLFQSLVLNSVYISNFMSDEKLNVPCWEKDIDSDAHNNTRTIAGYLDYLTWQSRMLLIAPPEGGLSESDRELFRLQNKIRVSSEKHSFSILRSQQYYCEHITLHDPLMCYFQTKEKGELPLRVDKNKVLWRNNELLYSASITGEDAAPWNLSALSKYANISERLSLSCFGIENSQAIVLFWKSGKIPFYPSILADSKHSETVKELFKITYRQLSVLERAMNELFVYMFFGDFDDLEKDKQKEIRDKVQLVLSKMTNNERTTEKNTKIINSAVSTMKLNPQRLYWSRLENEFYNILDRIAHSEFDDDGMCMSDILDEWSNTVFRLATNVYDASTSHLNANAENMKAQIKGRNKLFRINIGGQ